MRWVKIKSTERRLWIWRWEGKVGPDLAPNHITDLCSRHRGTNTAPSSFKIRYLQRNELRKTLDLLSGQVWMHQSSDAENLLSTAVTKLRC